MNASPVSFLLVDDLEENLLSLEALLKREGLNLIKARSGPQALELLLTHDVALALLDVQMPGMDGFELAELMRGTERTRRIPIIFLTAGTTDAQRRFRGYEAGAVDFLQKPIEPDVLRSKAEVFFELDRQRKVLEHALEQNAQLLKETQLNAIALQETDKRKDEFLATLAHELRNPLAPIRNGLQILRMQPSGEVAESTREIMERQVSHLVRLIDDLLDVSRVSEGKIELRKKTISLKEIIASATETSMPLIEEHHHHFEAVLPEEDIFLEADLTRIAQVISNLLNNAAKYTPDGGHITLHAVREGSTARIDVSDNGIGIPDAMQGRVFDLFVQLDRDFETSQGGLGIGLALVHRLVEMHGGTIEVSSAGPQCGSTFTVRLPVTTQPVQANEQSTPALSHTSRPLKVLVVDDNVESAKTTGWTLEMLGHDYAITHEGNEALARAKTYRPDVALLDIGLPGMNGYELCRALRADASLAPLTIIAQTGWGQEKDRQMAKEAGFDHHLTKPVDFDVLSALLEEASSKRR